MKNLRLFENFAGFQAAESTLVLPNVSYCVQENGINYKPSIPVIQHDYVEIGGIKWATMNVGANSVTDFGLYFQWGDTQGYTAAQVGEGEGQKYFSYIDYIYNTSGSYYSKYNDGDGLTTLQASDDAVTAAWGGNWRMPTISEFIALGEAVTTDWTADYQGSGVAGMVCTDKTDSSKTLFFPAGGHACQGSVRAVDGYYWSSSLYADYGGNLSYFLSLDSNDGLCDGNEGRHYGFSVRGVLDE